MHYRAVATRPWQRVTDILLVILGFVAMAVSFPLLFFLPTLSSVFVTSVFPAMVLIGPIQLVAYLFCRRRYGAERTTLAYRAAEA